MSTTRIQAVFDELAKMGAVSDEDAHRALDRYATLERNKPTISQVARYGGLGAVATPAIAAIGDLIAGNPVHGGPGKILRSVASKAVGGALASGAIPLARAHMDREAEKHTLRKYIHERGVGGPEVKEAAGAPTRGGFMMASEVPPMRVPSLASPLQIKAASGATTPAGLLSASKRVGTPSISAPPGPSIAQVSKPVGFGKPLAGALKNGV